MCSLQSLQYNGYNVYFAMFPDTIPGRQCMASCFFLLKQFEDVLIYLNSIKVRCALLSQIYPKDILTSIKENMFQCTKELCHNSDDTGHILMAFNDFELQNIKFKAANLKINYIIIYIYYLEVSAYIEC